MNAGERLRSPAGRLLVLLGGCLSAAVIVAVAASNLWQARVLHSQLNHAYVLGYARQKLQEPMLRGVADRRLRSALDDLMRRRDLGLRYIGVSDAEGVLLASVGVFEYLRLPLLRPNVSEGLRRTLYQLSGSLGQGRIVSAQGQLIGTVEYALSDTLVNAVNARAVERLRLSGWLGLLVGVPLLAGLSLALRRRLRVAPAWTRRLEWGGAASPLAASPRSPEDEATVFRIRAGTALDALRFGMISVDRDGRVRYLNPTAEALTGWTLADAQGRLVYSVFHPLEEDGSPAITVAELALREGRDVEPQECRARARDGTIRPVETMACLLRNDEGIVEGAAMLVRDVGDRVQRIDELRRQSRLSQGVIDHLDEGLLTTDPAGVVRFANARALRMFGYSREEMEGFTVTKLMPVPFLNTPGIRLTDYIASRHAGKLPKVVGWRKDATTFPVELWVQPMSVDGSAGLVVIVRDISERLRGENLATRLGRLLDSALEEVYIFDAQTLYYLEVNRGARRNLGYRPEQLARMTPLDISAGLEPETFHSYLARLRGGELEHLTYRCAQRRQDGSTYPVEVRLNFSREEEPPVFMAIAVDITERQAAEEKLAHLAHHDALTGLPNRAVLYDRLRQALLVAGRTARFVSVYFIDLDRFKQINDTHGHEVGDLVLKAASERLKAAVRASDTVARLGGDEFVIVAQGLRNVDDATQLAQKILDVFAEPLAVADLSLSIAPSVGYSIYPIDDSDAETLVRHADMAMYQAKEGGRGRFAMFNAEVDPAKRRQLELEREIHMAAALNQYGLLLTPVSDTRDGSCSGMLVDFEWQHPRHGRVESVEVLHAASRSGLLADIELWVVCQTCEQFQIAVRRGVPLVPAIVDVSGWQLRDTDFIAHVLELVSRYNVPPGGLVLALTPDGLAEARGTQDAVKRLVSRGVRFALREASGGFEGMNRDGGLPIGYVVLSRSAQQGARDARGGERLRRLIETAAAQERTVIAAGVDDAATRERLMALGCRHQAGALFHPAMGPREAAAWLAEASHAPDSAITSPTRD